VVLMSFSELALRRMRAIAPGIPRVFLMERVPVRCRTGFLPYGAAIAGPSIAIIRKHPAFVRRLHDSGNGCYVWTVDRSEDVDACAAAGVDGIITNRPELVARRLTSSGRR
jgi:glycerophosphoryl diester phosphodiesterase